MCHIWIWRIKCIKKPRIAIFGTGNELVDPGNSIKEGEIYNSNLYVFSDLVGNAGGEVLMQDVLKDNKAYLKSFYLRLWNPAM
ncbi:MAG: hypothetical protein CM1200mP1_04210 [Candidatus Neomarinimicrobiota bacterium]|nr:MAG: hypothetical protein CM1200mP1_04210 [Candidatus Neomarinimicrobiota bacterium]